jgi:hypothetical protein
MSSVEVLHPFFWWEHPSHCHLFSLLPMRTSPQDKMGVVASRISLICKGKKVPDDATPATLSLVTETLLHAVLCKVRVVPCRVSLPLWVCMHVRANCLVWHVCLWCRSPSRRS